MVVLVVPGVEGEEAGEDVDGAGEGVEVVGGGSRARFDGVMDVVVKSCFGGLCSCSPV